MGVYFQKKLPPEYQQVEYIQSSGNGRGTGQYINTGISIESGVSLKVEIDFHWLNNTTEERDIFSYYEGQYNDYIIGLQGGSFHSILNSHNKGTLPSTWTPNTYATNTRYKVVAEGVTVSSTNTPYLFASNENGTDMWDISAKLYYCKVWKDNVMIRDFVPCYRKADNVIGLYDLVNDQFYTNAGTGTFTKGNNVASELMSLHGAYIGEYFDYIEDSFEGTTLNTNIWDYTVYTSGSYSVNNGITLTGGASGQYGIAVYTKKKFTGNEKKITAEYTITMDGGTYRESHRGLLFTVSSAMAEVDQAMSTYNNTSRAYIQTGETSSQLYESVGIVNPTYTGKIVLDIQNNTYQIYINNNLHYQGTLQYALSNKIGDPLFVLLAKSWTNQTFTCTHVRIDIE